MKQEKANKVNSFNNLVCHLLSIKYTFDVLFSANEKDSQLFSSAKIFFYEVHVIYINSIILNMSKLLDPKETSGKSNLSINYMVEKILEEKNRQEIQPLLERLNAIKPNLKKSRNKIIAHSDLESILLDQPLGGFTLIQQESFFEALIEFTDYINREIFKQPFCFIPNCAGDVQDFLKAYKRVNK